ncbi:hypothetical protein OX88_21570 [Pseudomonas coronafaciens pv. porri]|nr:hypothetical protein OX88_21570 [Pseudomonas coronafaciens pv. porri]
MNSKIKIAKKIGLATIKLTLSATIPFIITSYLPPEYQVLLTLLMTISLGFYLIFLLIKGFCKFLEKIYSGIVTQPEKKMGTFKRAFYGLAKYLCRLLVVYILFVYSIFTVMSIHVS